MSAHLFNSFDSSFNKMQYHIRGCPDPRYCYKQFCCFVWSPAYNMLHPLKDVDIPYIAIFGLQQHLAWGATAKHARDKSGPGGYCYKQFCCFVWSPAYNMLHPLKDVNIPHMAIFGLQQHLAWGATAKHACSSLYAELSWISQWALQKALISRALGHSQAELQEA